MKYKETFGVFSDKTAEQISLLKYTKSSCGVDFLLNTAESWEKRGWFDVNKRYKTDFFEFYFFGKASGHLLLAGKRIELHDGMTLIISPYQQQEWHVDIDRLDYTFLVFQEEFINNFLSDKYFMYRLLYCYQNDYPTFFCMDDEDRQPLLLLLRSMKTELRTPVADSYHMIVAYLYQFLLQLNRCYARLFHLPFSPPQNNYAYQYKQLLEKNICTKTRVNDYAAMMGISRVSLNKAVDSEFGVSAMHLLKQRLLQEVKNDLLFTDLSVKEIAFRLNFSEPNHLMRFFKQQTGQTISEFLASVQAER
ncbi:helix-turn-helix domain-containing protein [Bacteroides timonensis]|uniref:helix-turn-helix domain-containing protein n=1 Tax=Bacteroides timonensis TaxID=1470345 RepID=UPI0004AF9789|nr:AraC family transcriptional regulator [Bacteroides timonensis]